MNRTLLEQSEGTVRPRVSQKNECRAPEVGEVVVYDPPYAPTPAPGIVLSVTSEGAWIQMDHMDEPVLFTPDSYSNFSEG